MTDGWAPDPDEAGEGVDDLEPDIDPDEYARMREALAEAQQRLADTPVQDIVANHVRGLFELATIHLFAAPPDLHAAALAIDAMGCLVEGLGDRLEPHGPVLREALHNSRLAFVQVKATAGDAPSAAPADATSAGAAGGPGGEAPEG